MRPVRQSTLALAIGFSLIGCESLDQAGNSPGMPQAVEDRHLTAPPAQQTEDIPDIVTPPVLSAPSEGPALELYSVVVQDVPVRDLLFAMARDANINVDVNSSVSGSVSLNAIDQTLPQMLERVGRQVDIRWRFERPDYLIVEPDLPHFRNYHVDYVNVARSVQSSVNVSSAVGNGGDGSDSANNSTTVLSQSAQNNFWPTLRANLSSILGEVPAEAELGASSIVVSPEAGMVSVRATAREHEQIFEFLESIKTRSLYQVLIEATLVEVSLNDRYQSGVDWTAINAEQRNISFQQNLTGLNLNDSPSSVLTLSESEGVGLDTVTSTIRLLNQFGDARILSSPKIMALNNQTAMLRVVDNRVYFTIEVEQGIPGTATSPAIPPTFTSTVNTVPVGFTMAVTPQISERDKVTLNVRPTISRILRFVDDPNPALADANVINAIPEIQIREIESVLQVDSGQIAILGGLMQDTVELSNDGLPGLNRVPVLGELFSYRDQNTIKTELIIFIRPVVIRQNSVDGDLQDYRQFLPNESTMDLGQDESILSL